MRHNFRELVTQENPNGSDPASLRNLLQGIQGNILMAHGRGHAVHILITFKIDKIIEALAWIADFKATTAWAERARRRPRIFRMLALTKAGYDVLGITPKDQPRNAAFQRATKGLEKWYSLHSANGSSTSNPLEGVHAMAIVASNKAADLAEDNWKKLVNSFSATYGNETDWCRYEIERSHLVFTDGSGKYDYGRRPEGSYYVEHFGYHDGISNPVFLKGDPTTRSYGAVDSKYGNWNPFAALNLVLAEEAPTTKYVANSYGSYLAFHKLEQNVPEFLRSTRMLALQFVVDDSADRLGTNLRDSQDAAGVKRLWDPKFHGLIDGFDAELEAWRQRGVAYDRRTYAFTYSESLKHNRDFAKAVLQTNPPDKLAIEHAGAKIVGRYRNGTPAFVPLCRFEDTVQTRRLGDENDFDYGHADPDARKCPFHAHARRMNTRGDLSRLGDARRNSDPRTQAPWVERLYRIARRGMPYGTVDEASLKERNEYQDEDLDYVYGGRKAASSVERGLLFLSFQTDLENFEILADVASAQNFFNSGSVLRDWPRPPNGEKTTRFRSGDYTTPRGSAYFFAPSLEFLRRIEEVSVLSRSD